jgi:RNA polymerase sigma-70 factor (ECF subfamily)
MTVWFRRPTPSPGDGQRAQGKTRQFEDLIALAKQLDSDALGELYQRFLPVVYGSVAARVPDKRLAEDITSEVFVSMLESISRLRATDEAGFAAWLLRITRFRIADHFRAQAGEVPLAPSQAGSEEGEEAEVLLRVPSRDPAGDPELTAEVREEWAEVAAAINQLTEDQRQVIVGKLILGYDNEMVARIVGKNVASVKALQHRGLQTLHRLLQGSAKLSVSRPARRAAPPGRPSSLGRKEGM